MDNLTKIILNELKEWDLSNSEGSSFKPILARTIARVVRKQIKKEYDSTGRIQRTV